MSIFSRSTKVNEIVAKRVGPVPVVNDFKHRIDEASKGILTGFVGDIANIDAKEGELVVPHKDKNWQLYQDVYERVPVVKNTVDNVANFAVQSGFELEGGSKETVQKLIDEYDFDLILINIIKQMQVFGNAYLEVSRTGDTINSLKLLPPDQMYVVVQKGGDNDGKVVGYKQKLTLTQRTISFTESEVIHFKWNTLGSAFYGTSDIKCVLGTITRLLNFQEDIGEIIHRYAQPIIHWKLGTENSPATTNQIGDFKSILDDRAAGEDLVTSYSVVHEIVAANIKALQPDGMIKHLENQIIAGLCAPDVFVRGGETSNKATAGVELQAFDRKVNSIRKVCTTPMSRKMFNGTKIVWNEMSIESQAIKAEMMANLSKAGIPPKLALSIVGWKTWTDEFDAENIEFQKQEMDKMEAQSKMMAKNSPFGGKPTGKPVPGAKPAQKPKEEDFSVQADYIDALKEWELKKGI